MAELPHDCPSCHGKGVFIPIFVKFVEGTPPEERVPPKIPCSVCRGKGKVSDAQLKRIAAGAEHKKKRLAAGYGLREYAELIGIKSSELSDMERGILNPEES